MSYVLNDWIVCDDDPATTVLRISGVYTVDVMVDTVLAPKLKDFSWCYEQAKGNVYMMDMSLNIPEKLGISSPRVYLWKYIIYITSGTIAKAWKRKNIQDYRLNQGTVLYLNASPAPIIAGVQ